MTAITATHKTVLEAAGILVLSLVLALLYHALTPSGIAVLKKRPAPPSVPAAPHTGGERHGP